MLPCWTPILPTTLRGDLVPAPILSTCSALKRYLKMIRCRHSRSAYINETRRTRKSTDKEIFTHAEEKKGKRQKTRFLQLVTCKSNVCARACARVKIQSVSARAMACHRGDSTHSRLIPEPTTSAGARTRSRFVPFSSSA